MLDSKKVMPYFVRNCDFCFWVLENTCRNFNIKYSLKAQVKLKSLIDPILLFDSKMMFMESPDFLFYSLHGMGAVTCPLQILGLYCILFKTPQTMNSVKWVLLNSHIWSLIFDITVTALTITFLVFPVLGTVPLGFLTTLFGVPIDIQAYLVFTLLFSMTPLIFKLHFLIKLISTFSGLVLRHADLRKSLLSIICKKQKLAALSRSIHYH